MTTHLVDQVVHEFLSWIIREGVGERVQEVEHRWGDDCLLHGVLILVHRSGQRQVLPRIVLIPVVIVMRTCNLTENRMNF